MKVSFEHKEKSENQILKLLQRDNALAKFKAPFNAYALLLAAALYNFSDIIITNKCQDMFHIQMLFVREMAAASIGVYGLARLYYIFVDTTIKRLLWYFLIITAAFNFGTFVQIATEWTHKMLIRFLG